MSAVTMIERCRMALSEVGLDPTLVRPGSGVPGDRVRVSLTLSHETRWLLLNTMQPDHPVCLPCFLAKFERWRLLTNRHERIALTAAAWAACCAQRPFQRTSCGVES